MLEKFKAGLPFRLLEPCLHHNDPQNWKAWTESARMCQAILTSLKAHQTDTTQRSPSPMKICTPTPPSTPPPVPMEIDKIYVVPAQCRSTSPKDEERCKGLCHLCKRHRHIQRYCPTKSPKPPAHAASIKITPLVLDQGVK